LDLAIAYYETRSARSKRCFYLLQGTQLVAATLVTALAAWPAESVPRPVLAMVSAVGGPGGGVRRALPLAAAGDPLPRHVRDVEAREVPAPGAGGSVRERPPRAALCSPNGARP